MQSIEKEVRKERGRMERRKIWRKENREEER